jgi:hypothetical protein
MEQKNALQDESPAGSPKMSPHAKYRQLNRRLLRRTLASLHTSACHPQLQSRLFTLLPLKSAS